MGGGCRIQAASFLRLDTVRRVFQTKSIDSLLFCRMGKAVIIEHSVNTGHTGWPGRKGIMDL